MCPFEVRNTLGIYTHEFQEAQARTSSIIENALNFKSQKEPVTIQQQAQNGSDLKIMGKQWAFAETAENKKPANPVCERICGN